MEVDDDKSFEPYDTFSLTQGIVIPSSEIKIEIRERNNVSVNTFSRTNFDYFEIRKSIILSKFMKTLVFRRDLVLSVACIDIKENSKHVVVRMPNAVSFRILIMEAARIAAHRHDSRVFLIKDAKVKPHIQIWLSIDFKKIDDDSTLFFSPHRFVEPADDTYNSSLYALFSTKTNHTLFLNSSDRSMKLSQKKLLDHSNLSFRTRLQSILTTLLMVNVNCRRSPWNKTNNLNGK